MAIAESGRLRGAEPEALPGGVGSVATIHLQALQRNVAAVREVIDGRFLWAVVKADAYGLGVLPISRALVQAGADGLAVARLEEALELRHAGFSQPILILGPLPRQLPEDPDLHLTAATVADLQRLVARAGPWPVHVKIDTGMGRLGLPADPASWLATAQQLGERWFALWSHYSRSECVGDPSIAEQQQRFTDCLSALLAAGVAPPQRHLSNSGGLIDLHPDESAVRVGLALYGVPPWTEAVDRPAIEAVVEWSAPLCNRRAVPAQTPISYGATYHTAAATEVCVLPVGYADGLPARPPQTIEVWTPAGRRPIRGRVTMDLSVVELAAEDRGAALDEAWLLGPVDRPAAPTVADLAAACGRLPYEVLTSLGPRVRRRYVP